MPWKNDATASAAVHPVVLRGHPSAGGAPQWLLHKSLPSEAPRLGPFARASWPQHQARLLPKPLGIILLGSLAGILRRARQRLMLAVRRGPRQLPPFFGCALQPRCSALSNAAQSPDGSFPTHFVAGGIAPGSLPPGCGVADQQPPTFSPTYHIGHPDFDPPPQNASFSAQVASELPHIDPSAVTNWTPSALRVRAFPADPQAVEHVVPTAPLGRCKDLTHDCFAHALHLVDQT
mmetsp:Transcript_56727/g.115612  ORF Transcript_56727/g.115612 Transcript_56727/m.115612 type:complete len:234 (+) Transcript_56727:618-1319(+)